MSVLNKHSTELSALNGIIQLIGNSTEANSIAALFKGSVTPDALDVVWDVNSEFTIPGDTYNSYTIVVLTGSINIGSQTIPLPPGTYTYGIGSNEKLNPLTIKEVTTAQVVILIQSK